jgi:hypothetical protein
MFVIGGISIGRAIYEGWTVIGTRPEKQGFNITLHRARPSHLAAYVTSLDGRIGPLESVRLVAVHESALWPKGIPI